MDTDTPRVDACANGDLSIYPLARQLERELSEARAERERADRAKAEGIKEGMRRAAEIAEQHASVEGIAQRIRAAILKEAGE